MGYVLHYAMARQRQNTNAEAVFALQQIRMCTSSLSQSLVSLQKAGKEGCKVPVPAPSPVYRTPAVATLQGRVGKEKGSELN